MGVHHSWGPWSPGQPVRHDGRVESEETASTTVQLVHFAPESG